MPFADAVGLGAALATISAVIVALLKEDLTKLWRRPKLRVVARVAPPDCHKTVLRARPTRGSDCSFPVYYFRVWVENEGNVRAEQVQVFFASLLLRHADGSFKEDTHFLPLNLKWAHSQQRLGGPEVFAEGISPGMGKHCDFGFIVHPTGRGKVIRDLPGVPPDKCIMVLDLEVSPNTDSDLLAPGVYRLVLKVAAANSKPVTKTLELTLDGDWYEDEARMFRDGVGLVEV
ncbi:MAG: hypothetical protein MUF27_09480 [Acidobacteria bacterium]|jgi:hypothetical protein|nr:hypothetical protein [Acidobacteriota bacterium]